MTNYLARLALLSLCISPTFADGAFVAPRVSGVPGGVVTFKLDGPADRLPTVVYDGPSAVVEEEVVDIIEGPDSYPAPQAHPGSFEEPAWQSGESDLDVTHLGTPPCYGPPPAPSQPWRSSS